MKTNKKKLIPIEGAYFLLFLVGVSLIGLFVLNFQLMQQSTRVAVLQNLTVALDKEWNIIYQGDTMYLEECNDFKLYVAVNESGECFRPINQMNNTQFTEIWNTCPTTVVVRCLT